MVLLSESWESSLFAALAYANAYQARYPELIVRTEPARDGAYWVRVYRP